MNIETMIYLADVASKITIVLALGSFIFLFATGLISMMMDIDAYGDEEKEKAHSFFQTYFVKKIKWGLMIIFIAFLMPSERAIYLMLGANYLKTSALPSKVEMAIEKKIDGYLNDKEHKK